MTKDLKNPQQKYLIQTFCLNMTLCFYRVAVPRHQSASHHIGFSQACPARLGKQHFPANHLLRRKEAVIWLLVGSQVNTLVSWVFSKLWEGEERNLICKGQMEQWKLFPPKDNLGHFYSIIFSYLSILFFLYMPKICTKTEIKCINHIQGNFRTPRKLVLNPLQVVIDRVSNSRKFGWTVSWRLPDKRANGTNLATLTSSSWTTPSSFGYYGPNLDLLTSSSYQAISH